MDSFSTGPLDFDPAPVYDCLIDHRENLMTTITLNLDTCQEIALIGALQELVKKWEKVHAEAVSGDRPNASPEGALLLQQDAESVLDMVLSQVNN